MTKQLKPCPFCGGKCDVVTGLGGITFFHCIKDNYSAQKLTDEEYLALCRFFETVEDEGTFDIGKLMIKTLSHKKAIVHIGFGRYQITDYGLDVIATMNFEG